MCISNKFPGDAEAAGFLVKGYRMSVKQMRKS